MFKFNDSNFIHVPNHPEWKVGVGDTIKCGQPYVIKNEVASMALETDTNLCICDNITDIPEVKNTEDFEITEGRYLRTRFLKDMVGLRCTITSNIVEDLYTSLSKGDTLIPTGTDFNWKVGTITTGGVGFKIVDFNTFGNFIIDGKKSVGGIVVEVVLG